MEMNIHTRYQNAPTHTIVTTNDETEVIHEYHHSLFYFIQFVQIIYRSPFRIVSEQVDQVGQHIIRK